MLTNDQFTVLVLGSSNYNNYKAYCMIMDNILCNYVNVKIVCGDSRVGVAGMTILYARERGYSIKLFKNPEQSKAKEVIKEMFDYVGRHERHGAVLIADRRYTKYKIIREAARNTEVQLRFVQVRYEEDDVAFEDNDDNVVFGTLEDKFPYHVDLVKTGENIKRIREEKGISLIDECVFFGFCSSKPINKWENGEKLPTLANMLFLSHLYQMEIREILVFYEDEWHKNS